MIESDSQAILAAILAAPQDDAPRLAYADWLDENGQEDRAEFIRLQIKIKDVPEEPPTCHPYLTNGMPSRYHDMTCDFCLWMDKYQWSRPLRKQIDLLLRKDVSHPNGGLRSQWEAWLGLDRVQAPKGESWFRRGFVAEVRCTLADWMAHGPAIVATHPVERVVLTDRIPMYDVSFNYQDGIFWYAFSQYKYEESILRHGTAYGANWLPAELKNDYESAAHFRAIEKANDWLSERAIAWAKSASALDTPAPTS
jgi:uncharacterized protein (TIGR02996 family)